MTFFNLFIRPYIESFQLNATPTAVGDFNLKTSLNTIFLFPYDVDLSKLKGRIRHIDFLLRQLDYILSHGNYFSVSSSYQTPFLKMDNVFNHSNYGSMTFSLNLDKRYFFRLYPFKRLRELILKALNIFYQALKFKDFLFIFLLIEYLTKLVITQSIFFLIFSLRRLRIIKKMNIISDLRK